MTEIGPSLLRNLPDLLAWLTGITVAVMMLRRGGGRAEKLLLIGSGLMFTERLLSPIILALLINRRDESGMSFAQIAGWGSLPFALLILAGIVCLIWAFRIRFRIRKGEPA